MKLLALLALISLTAHAEATLKSQLDAKTKVSHPKAHIKKVMDSSIEELRKARLTERAAKKGGDFPGFSLPGTQGKTYQSSTLLKDGPLIVTFYRGSWCPYCNIQLAEYQKHLEEWKKLGAQIVAISPELPDSTTAFAAKRNLTFPLLFDKDNEFASKLGLVYGLPADLKEVYKNFGVDLKATQGNDAWRLPIAATYVVGQDGKIAYSFLDVDYKTRAEPSEITAALKKSEK
jgi:peroxiredoxin